MSLSSFCMFWKKFSSILCLNVFGLLAYFKSDGRLFHVCMAAMIIIFFCRKTGFAPSPYTDCSSICYHHDHRFNYLQIQVSSFLFLLHSTFIYLLS